MHRSQRRVDAVGYFHVDGDRRAVVRRVRVRLELDACARELQQPRVRVGIDAVT
jgi:hypothetical protein